MIYHVSKKGSDQNSGGKEAPFLTIQRAANLAVAGDRVVVHEGVYREWVKPQNGGLSNTQRILYEAAEGERPVIKGSEEVTGWQKADNGIWRAEVPNHIFGGFNPFAEPVWGDWLVKPQDYQVHLGEVYLNGTAMYEAESMEKVVHPEKWLESPYRLWWDFKQPVKNPEQTVYRWYSAVKENVTVIYANFQGLDPNEQLIEINVRPACFYPEKTGLNYITVRGFEMAHAAASWAPPTADQKGMIGPHWSKGWIIEDNVLHDAKCCAVSLGKEASTGDNIFSKYHKKAGYHNQMEAVFLAKNIGWDKERIGSHIVRHNRIHDCGQTGIVGHLGCIFSEIYGNEIYDIATKREFWGHEIAGIKLHAAIDVQIHDNYIHNCTLGTWLDWQAQGTRISRNIYSRNDRDLMVEVTHGPYLVDNNIFDSDYNFDNAAQGGAYVHNLCMGFTNQYPVLERSTPYHLPHSTDILGTMLVYGFDDRWYQNMFVGGRSEKRDYGTALYDGAPTSMEEYIQRYFDGNRGDVESYACIKQPAYIDGNVYLNGARAFDREKNYYSENMNPEAGIETTEDGVYLNITIPEQAFSVNTGQIGTENLAMPRLAEQNYENPDGSPLVIDRDLLGNKISKHPVAGPLQNVKSGRNHILIWKKEI